MSELTSFIKQVMREELDILQQSNAQSKFRSSEELDAFVMRLVDLCQEKILNSKPNIRSRKIQPEITPTGQPDSNKTKKDFFPANTSGKVSEFGNGIVTEKNIRELPSDTTTIRIGATTRLTPLARDEIQLRGINLERSES